MVKQFYRFVEALLDIHNMSTLYFLGFGVCCLFSVSGACNSAQTISQVTYKRGFHVWNSSFIDVSLFTIELHLYSGEMSNPVQFEVSILGYGNSKKYLDFQNNGFPSADTAVSETCTYNFNRICDSKFLLFFVYVTFKMVNVANVDEMAF